MRLINAGFANCPLELPIDDHVMQVISLDSKDIESVDGKILDFREICTTLLVSHLL